MPDLRSTRTNQLQSLQAVDRMWRNSNASLLSEVCADDIVQENDESSTIKTSITKNKTPSKSFTQVTNLLHYLKITTISTNPILIIKNKSVK